jgi:hypothetical protein
MLTMKSFLDLIFFVQSAVVHKDAYICFFMILAYGNFCSHKILQERNDCITQGVPVVACLLVPSKRTDRVLYKN